MKRIKALLVAGALTAFIAIGCNDANNANDDDNPDHQPTTGKQDTNMPDAGKDVHVPDHTPVIDTSGDAKPDANTTYTKLDEGTERLDTSNNNRNNRRNR